MNALLVALVRILLRAAEAGTLPEIVETSAKLFGLIRPLITDPKAISAVESLAVEIQAFAPAPAQPEDPAMARVAPEHKAGGR